MPRPWTTLDRVDTSEGPLELRQRAEKDFVITVAGRVLMSSAEHRTERTVAEVACARLTGIAAPRVLLGGLGMGFTLRAALDSLPAAAQATVVEMNPVIERWCRGPLALLTNNVLDDPRVTLVMGDVAKQIRVAKAPALWHAIVLDLYEGPHAATQTLEDPFYGYNALTLSKRALLPGGILAVWSEERDKAFEERLATVGFTTERVPPPTSGPRHIVYLAKAGGPPPKPGAGGKAGAGGKPGAGGGRGREGGKGREGGRGGR
jgi:spermidine synthase